MELLAIDLDPTAFGQLIAVATLLAGAVYFIVGRRARQPERASWSLQKLESDLERAEKRLQEQDEQFAQRTAAIQRALGGASAAVIGVNDEGVIAYARGAIEEILGWPLGALDGRHVTVIVPHRLRAAHLAGFSRFTDTHELKLAGAMLKTFCLHADGTERQVSMQLARYDAGDAESVVAMIRPMADWVELGGRPRDMAAPVAFVDALVHGDPTAVVIADRAAFLIYANPAATALYHLAEPGMPLREYAQCFALVDRAGDLVPYERLPLVRATAGESNRGVYVLRADDGAPLSVSVCADPIRVPNGEQVGALLLARRLGPREHPERTRPLLPLGGRS